MKAKRKLDGLVRAGLAESDMRGRGGDGKQEAAIYCCTEGSDWVDEACGKAGTPTGTGGSATGTGSEPERTGTPETKPQVDDRNAPRNATGTPKPERLGGGLKTPPSTGPTPEASKKDPPSTPSERSVVDDFFTPKENP
jgi:hypothetical protein